MLATTWEEAGAQKEEELLLLKRKSHRVVISEDGVNEYFTCQVPATGKMFPVLGNLIHIFLKVTSGGLKQRQIVKSKVVAQLVVANLDDLCI